MFRVMFSPIIRSTLLYLRYLVVFTQVVAGWCSDGTPKHHPKHVETTWSNKLIYIVHLFGYFRSCITMHGFRNVKCTSTLLYKILFIYIYTHTHTHIYMCVCVYIYIYIYVYMLRICWSE